MPISSSDLGRVKTETRAIADLVAAGYNPRAMSEEKSARLAASLARFGLVQPLVVNRRSAEKGWPPDSKETLVGGHQRMRILLSQGATETDVVVVDLAAAEEKALNVTLNSPTVAGEFTKELGGLLEELKGSLPELSSALGFPGLAVDAAELSAAAGGDLQAIKEPASGATARLPITKPGDLYELGPHRLVCGDSTKEAVVARAMGGVKADVVYTDPPYGVSYEAASGNHDAIAGDDLRGDALLALLALLEPALRLAAAHAADAAAFYVWHASAARSEFEFAIKAAGLLERQYILWAKPSLVLGHADYQWAHEPCFYASKAGHSPAWYGGRAQTTVWRLEARRPEGTAVVLGPGLVISDGAGDELTVTRGASKRKLRALRIAAGEKVLVSADDRRTTVWEISRDLGVAVHPTQKPVALAARALLNSSQEGGHVLDVFGGACAVILAAEQLRRVAHVVELSPRYVDEGVARWERLTGRKAVRHAAEPEASKPKALSRKKA